MRVRARRELEFFQPPCAAITQRAVTWVHSSQTIGGPKPGAEGRGMERGITPSSGHASIELCNSNHYVDVPVTLKLRRVAFNS